MLKTLLIRAPGRPDSVLTLEKDSDLLRVSCNKFFALLTLEDTDFVLCGSNFILLRKLKRNKTYIGEYFIKIQYTKDVRAHIPEFFIIFSIGDRRLCHSMSFVAALGVAWMAQSF